MQIDFSQLTPGQAAAMTATATLLAALMAGIFAVVVAAVNAWASARNARLVSHREYRQSMLEPFLTQIEGNVPRLIEISQILARKQLNAYEALCRGDEDAARKRRQKDSILLISLLNDLYKPNTVIVDVSPVVRTFIRRDKPLSEAYERWHGLQRDTNGLLWASRDLFDGDGPSDDYEPAKVREAVNDTIESIVDLRQAAENFLYRQ